MTDPEQSGAPAEVGSAHAAPQAHAPVPPRRTMLDQGWRRLHPLSPLVRSGRGLLAVLALAGLSTSGIVGNGTGTRWYDVALPVLIAVAALVNWLVTRWKVDGATLRIETGLLRRDSRQLPIARIQAVDLVRPFFARMLGLAEIRVRLAGSGDADGRLAYLTEAAAFALRARLLAAHHGLDPATPEPAESVVTSVGTGRLAASALISAVPLAVVAVAVGAVIVATTPGGLFAAGAPLAWWLIVCGSIVWRRVSTQYAFTVAVSPDGVRIRRGLLGTVAETIPVPRIQAIRMVEPLLWRPLHWCRLEVDVAGALGHDRPEGTGAVRKALLPVGTKDEARRLLAVALPAASGWPALTRPPRRARLKALLSYHFLAAGHDGMLAVAVIGRVRRETTLVPLAKTQSVRLVQGPLQRRLGLATVHLDAAGKRVRAEFRERQQEQARSLVGELAALSRSARMQASLAAGPVVQPRPGEAGGPGYGPEAAGQAASVASPVNASQSEA
ncbi:MAG TPA: PH domain-containing protein [Streptosporangiaceae bacterium]|nr:PH domain-containing protein [Streptosporangiaceae bacterium]